MKHFEVVCFCAQLQNIVLNMLFSCRELARYQPSQQHQTRLSQQKPTTESQKGTKKAIATGRNSLKSKHPFNRTSRN